MTASTAAGVAITLANLAFVVWYCLSHAVPASTPLIGVVVAGAATAVAERVRFGREPVGWAQRFDVTQALIGAATWDAVLFFLPRVAG